MAGTVIDDPNSISLLQFYASSILQREPLTPEELVLARNYIDDMLYRRGYSTTDTLATAEDVLSLQDQIDALAALGGGVAAGTLQASKVEFEIGAAPFKVDHVEDDDIDVVGALLIIDIGNKKLQVAGVSFNVVTQQFSVPAGYEGYNAKITYFAEALQDSDVFEEELYTLDTERYWSVSTTTTSTTSLPSLIHNVSNETIFLDSMRLLMDAPQAGDVYSISFDSGAKVVDSVAVDGNYVIFENIEYEVAPLTTVNMVTTFPRSASQKYHAGVNGLIRDETISLQHNTNVNVSPVGQITYRRSTIEIPEVQFDLGIIDTRRYDAISATSSNTSTFSSTVNGLQNVSGQAIIIREIGWEVDDYSPAKTYVLYNENYDYAIPYTSVDGDTVIFENLYVPVDVDGTFEGFKLYQTASPILWLDNDISRIFNEQIDFFSLTSGTDLHFPGYVKYEFIAPTIPAAANLQIWNYFNYKETLTTSGSSTATSGGNLTLANTSASDIIIREVWIAINNPNPDGYYVLTTENGDFSLTYDRIASFVLPNGDVESFVVYENLYLELAAGASITDIILYKTSSNNLFLTNPGSTNDGYIELSNDNNSNVAMAMFVDYEVVGA